MFCFTAFLLRLSFLIEQLDVPLVEQVVYFFLRLMFLSIAPPGALWIFNIYSHTLSTVYLLSYLLFKCVFASEVLFCSRFSSPIVDFYVIKYKR